MTNDIYGRFVKRDASRNITSCGESATLMAGFFMVSITWLIRTSGRGRGIPHHHQHFGYAALCHRDRVWITLEKSQLAGRDGRVCCRSDGWSILRFGLHFDVAPVTLMSGGVALLVCPIVSLMTGLLKCIRTDSLSLSVNSMTL